MNTNPLNLSNPMTNVLASAVLTLEGTVECFVSDARTRNALCARGARENAINPLRVCLNLALTVAAVEAQRRNAREHTRARIARELAATGVSTSGHSDQTTAELWAMVRAGQLCAEAGMVPGWGHWLMGWSFASNAGRSNP